MAIARQTDHKLVEPLTGSIKRRYQAGVAIEAGEIVEMQSDGYVDPADTTAASVNVLGVALQDVSALEWLDVVVFGPVKCLTGATIGSTVHASDTAGEPSESAGSNSGIVGFNESATVLFVNPVIGA